MKLVTLIVVGCLVLQTTARAASFDCGKAASDVEQLVCETPMISKLDDVLAKSFQKAKKDANSEQRHRLVNDQQFWSDYIRGSCSDVSCIKQAYQTRLIELKTFFEPETKFCAEVRKLNRTVVSKIKGAHETFYVYALDKYYLHPDVSSVGNFSNLDIDGDGNADIVEMGCSASLVLPGGPCTLTVSLSSGSGFDFEGWNARLLRYREKYYVIAHHDDEARYRLFTDSPNPDEGVIYHPEVAAAIKYKLYMLNASGATLACNNL